LPLAQSPLNSMTLFVRNTSDPLSLVSAVRSQVLAVDKNQPIYDVKTLNQRVSDATAVSRSLTVLFGAFALLAVVLGSVGIYGIVSYAVTQRTQEIGVRMALGAQARDILQLILKHGVVLVLTGVAIGVAGALALTRFLSTLLFGITPTDTLTFVVVSAIFFLIAMIASLIPARRATKVDPLIALRYE
jgi:putative ABC transport system permease protein